MAAANKRGVPSPAQPNPTMYVDGMIPDDDYYLVESSDDDIIPGAQPPIEQPLLPQETKAKKRKRCKKQLIWHLLIEFSLFFLFWFFV